MVLFDKNHYDIEEKCLSFLSFTVKMKVYFDIEADEFYQEIPFIRSFSFFMLKDRNISCRSIIPRFRNIFIAISYQTYFLQNMRRYNKT